MSLSNGLARSRHLHIEKRKSERFMKRLVISGFPCTKEAWIRFLGPETEVLSFADILNATRSSDMNRWGEFVAKTLLQIQPDSVICHDFGGVACLKALVGMKPGTWEQTMTLTV